MAVADPVRQTAVEALPLGQFTSDRVDDQTVQELEVGRMPEVDAAEPGQQRVEEPGAQPCHGSVAVTAAFHGVDDHRAVAPLLDHLRD